MYDEPQGGVQHCGRIMTIHLFGQFIITDEIGRHATMVAGGTHKAAGRTGQIAHKAVRSVFGCGLDYFVPLRALSDQKSATLAAS